MDDNAVGQSIPAATQHAVSVSLPTWRANVGYEEGEDWIIQKMQTGYPRFFVHKSIQALCQTVLDRFGREGERAAIFPSRKAAALCVSFALSQSAEADDNLRMLLFGLTSDNPVSDDLRAIAPQFCAILFPESLSAIVKCFWQHSGAGISSRQAEFCTQSLRSDLLSVEGHIRGRKGARCGPKRYLRESVGPRAMEVQANEQLAISHVPLRTGETNDASLFLEERFGRNLDFVSASDAKATIRRRIADSIFTVSKLDDTTSSTRAKHNSESDDIFLYSCGMNAIFNAHQILLATRSSALKSISFGFPYIDTLKILQKFGPGCLFYGHGSTTDLDDLERRLENGERYLALFCEVPGNPLLRTPDLHRIHSLAERYEFAVVIDETIGNFLNIDILPFADIVVSSLTKVFSGDSNVMGGSAVLNPQGRYYAALHATWAATFEDNLWAEDAIFLERNSRDFVSRNQRINENAEAICLLLGGDPRVDVVNYPKLGATSQLYERYRRPSGGYGGLLSMTFHNPAHAIMFFDNIKVAKGPSLGTNFTLCSPYVILAHYGELDWAKSFGVRADLIRFSIGLEETSVLLDEFRRALAMLQ